MTYLADRHSYACETGNSPDGGAIKCFIPSCKNFAYTEDLEIIKSEWKKRNVELTNEQAEELWGLFSESVCAGWIGIDKSSNHTWVWEATKEFINNVTKT